MATSWADTRAHLNSAQVALGELMCDVAVCRLRPKASSPPQRTLFRRPMDDRTPSATVARTPPPRPDCSLPVSGMKVASLILTLITAFPGDTRDACYIEDRSGTRTHRALRLRPLRCEDRARHGSTLSSEPSNLCLRTRY